MTQDELTIFRLQVRLFVQKEALRTAMKVARMKPGADQALSWWAEQTRKEAAKTVIPGLKPGYSDLMTAELQEAIEELIAEMKA